MKIKKITSKWLISVSACDEAVEAFERQGETDSIKILKLLISNNKLDWANWLIVRLMTIQQCIAYAVYAAEQVINIYQCLGDNRPRNAIEAAKKCIENDTEENRLAAELAAEEARAAARSATCPATRWSVAWASTRAAEIAAGTAPTRAAWAVEEAAESAEMKIKILWYGIKLLEGKVKL